MEGERMGKTKGPWEFEEGEGGKGGAEKEMVESEEK